MRAIPAPLSFVYHDNARIYGAGKPKTGRPAILLGKDLGPNSSPMGKHLDAKGRSIAFINH